MKLTKEMVKAITEAKNTQEVIRILQENGQDIDEETAEKLLADIRQSDKDGMLKDEGLDAAKGGVQLWAQTREDDKKIWDNWCVYNQLCFTINN